MSNRFTSRLSDDDDFKRDELIRKIEHSVEQMTLSELEALSYDMFTKGYIGGLLEISIIAFNSACLFHPFLCIAYLLETVFCMYFAQNSHSLFC